MRRSGDADSAGFLSYDDGIRWQLMCVFAGSCGKVQKKLRLCIVENSDLAVDTLQVDRSVARELTGKIN